MLRHALNVLLLVAVVVLAFAGRNIALGGQGQEIFRVATIEEEGILWRMAEFHPQLTAKIKELGAIFTIAYNFSEGTDMDNSFGICALYVMPDKEHILWLVRARVVSNGKARAVHALYYIAERQWAEALERALFNRLRFPTPRTFAPNRYMFVEDGETVVKYRGQPF